MGDGSGEFFEVSPYRLVSDISECLLYDKTMNFPFTIIHNGRVLDPLMSFKKQNVNNGDTIMLVPDNLSVDFDLTCETSEEQSDKVENEIFNEYLRISDMNYKNKGKKGLSDYSFGNKSEKNDKSNIMDNVCLTRCDGIILPKMWNDTKDKNDKD